MQHPRWNDRIRRKTEAVLGGRLPEEDWQYVLDERYLEDDIDDLPKDEQATVLAQEIRKLRRVGELPRSRRSQRDSYRHRIVRGWISDDESTMAAAVSDAMYWRALSNPDVRRARDYAAKHGLRRSESQVRDGWVAGDASFSIREFPDEHGADKPRSRARIVLEFDPWLSKETVAETYEKLRRQLIGKGRKRPEFPELEAFRFVVSRLRENGTPKRSWSAIGREWNEEHAGSDWTYSKPVDIRRTYLGVRGRIINAEYDI